MRSRTLARLGALAVVGAGIGLGLALLLEPRRGPRRRAALRSLLQRAGEAGGRSGLAQRSRELALLVRSRLGAVRRGEEPLPLADRVRARVESVASHPETIEVETEGGVVRLFGSVPLDELDEVAAEVATVEGVREVHNMLRAELPPPHVPGEH